MPMVFFSDKGGLREGKPQCSRKLRDRFWIIIRFAPVFYKTFTVVGILFGVFQLFVNRIF